MKEHLEKNSINTVINNAAALMTGMVKSERSANEKAVIINNYQYGYGCVTYGMWKQRYIKC